jgi:hypothetical protein
MASDFYLEAVRERANAIEMELASCKADLLVHRQNGSLSEAGEAVQRIADLTSQQSNLQAMTQGYIQSQQPAQPEQLTDEERNARPWHKMTPDDGLALARQSKYGRTLDWNDGHVRAGYAEAQRRRHRGE